MPNVWRMKAATGAEFVPENRNDFTPFVPLGLKLKV
jgi:hypothetical protein